MNITKNMIDTAKNVTCEKCGSQVLKQAFVIKTISALVSPDGKETLMPIPVFICNSCNHLNEVFAKELNIKTSDLVLEK